jgi:hypothetical protein
VVNRLSILSPPSVRMLCSVVVSVRGVMGSRLLSGANSAVLGVA